MPVYQYLSMLYLCGLVLVHMHHVHLRPFTESNCVLHARVVSTYLNVVDVVNRFWLCLGVDLGLL